MKIWRLTILATGKPILNKIRKIKFLFPLSQVTKIGDTGTLAHKPSLLEKMIRKRKSRLVVWKNATGETIRVKLWWSKIPPPGGGSCKRMKSLRNIGGVIVVPIPLRQLKKLDNTKMLAHKPSLLRKMGIKRKK